MHVKYQFSKEKSIFGEFLKLNSMILPENWLNAINGEFLEFSFTYMLECP